MHCVPRFRPKVYYGTVVRAHTAMHMSGAMSGHCGQTLGKTLKGDEEPWVDDVYDDLLEGLEAEEGHGAAVSPQRVDRIEERLQDVEQEVRSGKGDHDSRSLQGFFQ